MGRYSSDSDEDYRRSRKKKKKRSRSRSYDSDDSRKRSRKSKKSKKKSKRYSRSRSRSSERSRRRRRSHSRERRRHSRSRSKSRSRRSSSRSRQRRSRSRHRSSSRSRRKSRSRSASRSKSKRNRSRSRSVDSKADRAALENVDPCLSIPGFLEMSQAERNEVRMKMAIKAAAATDAKLREQGLLASNVGIKSETVTYDQLQHRAKRVHDIDGGAFVQESFTSSKSQPRAVEVSADQSHESAIFSASSSIEALSKNIVYKTSGSLLGPIFYESVDAKWDRWTEKVTEFRKKRLEGEVIS